MKLEVAQIRGVHLVQMGLNSSNLAIRVGMKNISRKGGVGLKGGLLWKGGDGILHFDTKFFIKKMEY